MMVVTIGNKVEFMTKQASTSPVYKDENGRYYTRDKDGRSQFSGLTDFAINTCIDKRKAISDKRGIPLTDAEKNQDCYRYISFVWYLIVYRMEIT